ncbi:PHB depolymerase family esterase [Sulfitobacter sp. LCG007]
MNSDFATAMGRALEFTRSGNAHEATRIIAAALGSGAPTWPTPAAQPQAGAARQPLGRVIASLVNGGVRKASGMSSFRAGGAQPCVPEGAQYLERRHQSVFGSREYRLFVPSPRTEQFRGVVLMLHGCTQSADDFAAGTRMNEHAERENLMVAYPQQGRSDNAMGCWNWFQPGDQKKGAGEPAILAGLARELAEEYGVTADRIFAAGLSAGGAMAAILGAAYPEVFHAVGVHSGLAPGAASDVASAYAAMHGQGSGFTGTAPVRTILFHGTADQTVHPSNADRVLLSALGSCDSVEFEDRPAAGRAARRTIHQDVMGNTLAERWLVEGAGHAWSGGSADGSYTDPAGPDASAEIIRFFMQTCEKDDQ